MSSLPSAELQLTDVIYTTTICIAVITILLRYNKLEWLLTITVSLSAGSFLLYMLETHFQLDLTNITYYYLMLFCSVAIMLRGRNIITLWQGYGRTPLHSLTRLELTRGHILEGVVLLTSTLHFIHFTFDFHSKLPRTLGLSLYVCIITTAAISITRHVYEGESHTRTTPHNDITNMSCSPGLVVLKDPTQRNQGEDTSPTTRKLLLSIIFLAFQVVVLALAPYCFTSLLLAVDILYSTSECIKIARQLYSNQNKDQLLLARLTV